MIFKRIKARFGGGTTVDTIVHTPVAQPGGRLDGVVEVVGGEFEQEIKYLALTLVCRVEVETDDSEHQSDSTFARQVVEGEFTLHPGQRRSVPFSMDVPLETPFNVVNGGDLRGVRLGVRTELEIAKSFDKGDYDPIRVEPLPAQQRILGALERIGCRFKSSDVERGQIRGSTLPFYQELEFYPPASLSRSLNEVEVTFLTRPHEIEVVLEGDKKAGLLTEGDDRVRRLPLPYDFIDSGDLDRFLDEQLHELARRRGLFG
ncbi:sporulation protein [Pseudonocardia humida]|uniref:Sporulation protein n=1 Tax=Pseudonocardia humida TaxID=2800819 RepID=A0ABT1AAZ9_9PSEU|nr:sporulation protein [Pseudonocardia humida]MCO1660226.1 sporulation protein [Pseudonocardia humida]